MATLANDHPPSRRRRDDAARSLVRLALLSLAVAALCSELEPARARLAGSGLGESSFADALTEDGGDDHVGPSLAAALRRRVLRTKKHKALLPLDASDRYGFFFATLGLMVCHFFLEREHNSTARESPFLILAGSRLSANPAIYLHLPTMHSGSRSRPAAASGAAASWSPSTSS